MFKPCLSQLYLLPIDHCHIGISQLIAANLKGFFSVYPRVQNPLRNVRNFAVSNYSTSCLVASPAFAI